MQSKFETPEPQSMGFSTSSTSSRCDDKYDSKDEKGYYDCLVGCREITQELAECVATYGYTYWVESKVGNYYLIYHAALSCDDTVTSELTGGKWYDEDKDRWQNIGGEVCDPRLVGLLMCEPRINRLCSSSYCKEALAACLPKDCDELKSTASSSITTWLNNPTADNKNNALSGITEWVSTC